MFVITADLHRNAEIAQEKGKSTEVLGSFDYCLRSFSDAFISAQNIVIAAESMGLGTVYLGSILNDAQAVIDLIYCIFQNTLFLLSAERLVHNLENYDQTVSQYYDLRSKNRRIDTFTNQIAKAMDKHPEKRMSMLDVLKSQGFIQY
ncbi:MAG: NADPH-dependent oxidoreductase [Massilibacillus sp.]|nr:NADPH-dependent oxidoreductase [Massilibacillus sp.]